MSVYYDPLWAPRPSPDVLVAVLSIAPFVCVLAAGLSAIGLPALTTVRLVRLALVAACLLAATALISTAVISLTGHHHTPQPTKGTTTP